MSSSCISSSLTCRLRRTDFELGPFEGTRRRCEGLRSWEEEEEERAGGDCRGQASGRRRERERGERERERREREREKRLFASTIARPPARCAPLLPPSPLALALPRAPSLPALAPPPSAPPSNTTPTLSRSPSSPLSSLLSAALDADALKCHAPDLALTECALTLPRTSPRRSPPDANLRPPTRTGGSHAALRTPSPPGPTRPMDLLTPRPPSRSVSGRHASHSPGPNTTWSPQSRGGAGGWGVQRAEGAACDKERERESEGGARDREAGALRERSVSPGAQGGGRRHGSDGRESVEGRGVSPEGGRPPREERVSGARAARQVAWAAAQPRFGGKQSRERGGDKPGAESNGGGGALAVSPDQCRLGDSASLSPEKHRQLGAFGLVITDMLVNYQSLTI
eukprot:1809284-Rhodomonas_salina.1